MNTSTKLILLLTLAVGVVMTLTGYFILRQREAILVTAMHNEVRAHALTLQITLEDAYRAGRITDAQRLIDRLSANPKIHSVILFEETGRAVMLSDPLVADEIRQPPEVKRVIETGEAAEVVRRLGGQEVFSIIMPLRVSAERRGAFEITQPMSFIEADVRRARRDIALIALALSAVIVLVVLAVTRRSLLDPIKELLGGATALGRGDLSYRVIVPAGSREFAQLAREFNRMADSLAAGRRAAEQEAEDRLALERELRHSERLASVGRLAAGVAHEMGAPLNVIKGRVGMIKAAPDMPPEKRDRNLTIIAAQADGITHIVRQLLNLARPYRLNRAPLGLARLLADSVEAVEGEAAQKGVTVEAGRADHVQVDGDRDLLRQAFLNLLVNAVHATPAGGRLLLEAGATEVTKGGHSFVPVRVADSGPGIAPEHLPHVFDPFFTTKDVGEGTGLGLAVTRRIVEEHGGWIEAANSPAGGAVFTVYLPQAGAQNRQRELTTAGEAHERKDTGG
jgi:two-component system, NtrC family, sensor kinase